MRGSPLDVARQLTIPAGFTIAVYARIAGARFMAITPDGNLLVSNPGAGTISLVRPNSAGDPLVSTFVSGLTNPHDIVFHTIGGITYLYIAESNQINRFVYTTGALTAQGRQIIISGLPDASTPELRGAYAHALKNIALDGNAKLYLSIASSCNLCIADTQSSPVRGAIYQYNADGTGGRLFARGLRNAEGLAFVPGTNTLWVVINNRDNIPYPLHTGPYTYGQVVTAYVDNHPPDEFTSVRDGGNYGWPFCAPTPDSPNGLNNMPFDPSVDPGVNDAGQVDCTTMDRIVKGIQAHSAPLGLTFFEGTAVPAAYQNGAAVGLHGSWNRSAQTGYKVAYFPWDPSAQLPGNQIDLVTGWSNGTSDWGRPVDIAVDHQGAILISDDLAGVIYKLVSTSTPPPPPPPTQSVTGFALINADNNTAVAGFSPLTTGAQLICRRCHRT